MVKCKRQGCFNKAEPGSAFCKDCMADMRHEAMSEHPEPQKTEKEKTPPPKYSSSYNNFWTGYNPERDKVVDAGLNAGWKLFKKLLSL